MINKQRNMRYICLKNEYVKKNKDECNMFRNVYNYT